MLVEIIGFIIIALLLYTLSKDERRDVNQHIPPHRTEEPLTTNVKKEKVTKSQNKQDDNAEEEEHKSMMAKMKNSLVNVKVSYKDALLVEQQLDHFSKWNEDSEYMQMRGISIDKFSDFLKHLEKCYKGIVEEDTEKMKLIAYGKEYTSRIVEWKFKTDDFDASATQKSRYGIMALAKSSDGKFIDIMLAVYTLQFKLAATVTTVQKEYSAFMGLVTWTTKEDKEVAKYIDKEAIEKFQNFFRLKALKAFEQEGIIDQITYTDHPALL